MQLSLNKIRPVILDAFNKAVGASRDGHHTERKIWLNRHKILGKDRNLLNMNLHVETNTHLHDHFAFLHVMFASR